MDNKNYDLLIVGAGPAGLTAAIYASRYKIKHAVIGTLPGGTMIDAHKICNFPSEASISGWELSQKIENNVRQLGSEIIAAEVVKIIGKFPNFQVELSDGQKLSTKSILLATGTKRRRLALDNEDKFLGKGLAYCATCDGPFFKDKIVGILGGGNSGATAVLYLSDIAAKIIWFYSGDKPSAVEPSWMEEIAKRNNVEQKPKSRIVELLGEDRLSGLSVEHPEQIEQVILDGLFVEIGSDPNSDLLKQLEGQIDGRGYIITAANQSSSIKGVWAAGDATTSSNGLRQIVTACSEGAIAADSIFSFLSVQ
jgi:thioredoxin reductase